MTSFSINPSISLKFPHQRLWVFKQLDAVGSTPVIGTLAGTVRMATSSIALVVALIARVIFAAIQCRNTAAKLRLSQLNFSLEFKRGFNETLHKSNPFNKIFDWSMSNARIQKDPSIPKNEKETFAKLCSKPSKHSDIKQLSSADLACRNGCPTIACKLMDSGIPVTQESAKQLLEQAVKTGQKDVVNFFNTKKQLAYLLTTYPNIATSASYEIVELLKTLGMGPQLDLNGPPPGTDKRPAEIVAALKKDLSPLITLAKNSNSHLLKEYLNKIQGVEGELSVLQALMTYACKQEEHPYQTASMLLQSFKERKAEINDVLFEQFIQEASSANIFQQSTQERRFNWLFRSTTKKYLPLCLSLLSKLAQINSGSSSFTSFTDHLTDIIQGTLSQNEQSALCKKSLELWPIDALPLLRCKYPVMEQIEESLELQKLYATDKQRIKVFINQFRGDAAAHLKTLNTMLSISIAEAKPEVSCEILIAISSIKNPATTATKILKNFLTAVPPDYAKQVLTLLDQNIGEFSLDAELLTLLQKIVDETEIINLVLKLISAAAEKTDQPALDMLLDQYVVSNKNEEARFKVLKRYILKADAPPVSWLQTHKIIETWSLEEASKLISILMSKEEPTKSLPLVLTFIRRACNEKMTYIEGLFHSEYEGFRANPTCLRQMVDTLQGCKPGAVFSMLKGKDWAVYHDSDDTSLLTTFFAANIPYNIDQFDSLMIHACTNAYENIIQMLDQRGLLKRAGLETINYYLFCALQNKHYNLSSFLIDKGASAQEVYKSYPGVVQGLCINPETPTSLVQRLLPLLTKEQRSEVAEAAARVLTDAPDQTRINAFQRTLEPENGPILLTEPIIQALVTHLPTDIVITHLLGCEPHCMRIALKLYSKKQNEADQETFLKAVINSPFDIEMLTAIVLQVRSPIFIRTLANHRKISLNLLLTCPLYSLRLLNEIPNFLDYCAEVDRPFIQALIAKASPSTVEMEGETTLWHLLNTKIDGITESDRDAITANIDETTWIIAVSSSPFTSKHFIAKSKESLALIDIWLSKATKKSSDLLNTLLKHAAEQGNTELVSRIFKTGIKTETGSHLGVLLACKAPKPEIVQLFVNNGADVNKPHPKYPNLSPLVVVTIRSLTEIKDILEASNALCFLTAGSQATLIEQRAFLNLCGTNGANYYQRTMKADPGNFDPMQLVSKFLNEKLDLLLGAWRYYSLMDVQNPERERMVGILNGLAELDPHNFNIYCSKVHAMSFLKTPCVLGNTQLYVTKQCVKEQPELVLLAIFKQRCKGKITPTVFFLKDDDFSMLPTDGAEPTTQLFADLAYNLVTRLQGDDAGGRLIQINSSGRPELLSQSDKSSSILADEHDQDVLRALGWFIMNCYVRSNQSGIERLTTEPLPRFSNGYIAFLQQLYGLRISDTPISDKPLLPLLISCDESPRVQAAWSIFQERKQTPINKLTFYFLIHAYDVFDSKNQIPQGNFLALLDSYANLRVTKELEGNRKRNAPAIQGLKGSYLSAVNKFLEKTNLTELPTDLSAQVFNPASPDLIFVTIHLLAELACLKKIDQEKFVDVSALEQLLIDWIQKPHTIPDIDYDQELESIKQNHEAEIDAARLIVEGMVGLSAPEISKFMITRAPEVLSEKIQGPRLSL